VTELRGAGGGGGKRRATRIRHRRQCCKDRRPAAPTRGQARARSGGRGGRTEGLHQGLDVQHRRGAVGRQPRRRVRRRRPKAALLHLRHGEEPPPEARVRRLPVQESGRLRAWGGELLRRAAWHRGVADQVNATDTHERWFQSSQHLRLRNSGPQGAVELWSRRRAAWRLVAQAVRLSSISCTGVKKYFGLLGYISTGLRFNVIACSSAQVRRPRRAPAACKAAL
jgi:hypothetical protein